MRHIPNFITSLNLASGFTAIVFLFKGDPVTASWLILAGMLFDFSDGLASRLLNAYSDIGKELDSLADLVTFGVAPALMIYHFLSRDFLHHTLLPEKPALLFSLIAYPVPVLFAVCSGLRLAKFNTDTTQATTFRGLPTPAAALAVVSLLLPSVYSESEIIASFISSPLLVIIFSLTISLLMVSRLPMLSFKFKSWGFRGNEGKYVLLITCLLLVGLLRWSGIPLLIPSYIAVSLGFRN